MELYSINTASIYYPFVEDLFHSAFPEKERRLDKDQRENIDDQPLMSCLLISENSAPVGFITKWDFGKFLYIEHFAIALDRRGQGFGSASLAYFLQIHSGIPVVLEVEPPVSIEAQRRVEFYQKAGFHLCKLSYSQPAYPGRANANFDMNIMCYGTISQMFLEKVVFQLYSVVYQINN